ncbi:hypothetical protein SDC9_206488 [bioreactor metagenome]|uniref:Uncharacterized protein n=1 Tax=bioreactor metagenome TaxID=1076179 RepID=A0A645JEG1_9ZZZZ
MKKKYQNRQNGTQLYDDLKNIKKIIAACSIGRNRQVQQLIQKQ